MPPALPDYDFMQLTKKKIQIFSQSASALLQPKSKEVAMGDPHNFVLHNFVIVDPNFDLKSIMLSQHEYCQIDLAA